MAGAGRKRYETGEYLEAVKWFLKLLGACGDDRKLRLAVLDMRAACFVRLHLGDRAVRDAKEAVRVDPRGCKGYLRWARVLADGGRWGEACAVASRGLETVDQKRANPLLVQQLQGLLHKGMEEARAKRGGAEDVRGLLKRRMEDLERRLAGEAPASMVPAGAAAIVPASATPDGKRAVAVAEGKRSLDPPAMESKRARTSNPVEVPDTPLPLQDPISLPLPVLWQLLSLLPTATVLSLRLLSSQWNRFVGSLPEAYPALTFRKHAPLAHIQAGLSQAVKAHRHRNIKRVLLRLVPKGGDERMAIRNAFQKVRLDYTDLEVSLGHVGLAELVAAATIGTHNPLHHAESMRFVGPYDGGVASALLAMPLLHTLQTVAGSRSTRLVALPMLSESHSLRSLSLVSLIKPPMVPPALPSLPRLTSLVICGYDLRQGTLPPLPATLRTLVLEQVGGVNFEELLLVLATSGCRLDRLMLRESKVERAVHLRDFREAQVFAPLVSLTSLDIVGSLLLLQGIMAVLGHTPCLTTLGMGQCQYVVFANGSSRSQPVFSLESVLQSCPQLTHLDLHELTGLNDYTLKRFGEVAFSLRHLDLSFNLVTGVGIMDLFHAHAHVDTLLVHSCGINPASLTHAVAAGWCDRASGEPKDRWREYGKNLYLP